LVLTSIKEHQGELNMKALEDFYHLKDSFEVPK